MGTGSTGSSSGGLTGSTSAASGGSSGSTGSIDAGSPPADAGAVCPPIAGELIEYVIPPPTQLDWSTPNNLLNTAISSALAGQSLVSSGAAVMSHEIGHVNLELDCGDAGFPLTGQTGGGEEWESGADGLGILFRLYPGSLNEFNDSIGDNADTVADIAARQASGNLTRMRFLVNGAMCARLKAFHDEYIATQAYLNYDGLYRARRFEGAGCAIFGAGMIDVGGLLRRSLFTPIWARSEFVGTARFANNGGVNAFYYYGSNLEARDSSGVVSMWPTGVNVPAPQLDVIVPDSTVMDQWTGPEDTPFNIPNVTLPPALQSAVPFTLYDPQLMQQWAESVWSQAADGGAASSLQSQWTAEQVQAVHQITTDASCVMPQTLAFTADNDDLFKDSDAP